MKNLDYSSFNAVSISKDEIIMFSNEYNYFMLIDRKNLRIKDVGVLPEEEFLFINSSSGKTPTSFILRFFLSINMK